MAMGDYQVDWQFEDVMLCKAAAKRILWGGCRIGMISAEVRNLVKQIPSKSESAIQTKVKKILYRMEQRREENKRKDSQVRDQAC